MVDELLPLSRRAWGDLEVLHLVGYFAPEVTKEYVDLGLDARLAYFPARSAAFGATGPGLTVATFYVFAPWLAEAVLPSVWQSVTPARMVEARRAGIAATLDRALGKPDVGEALAIAREVCEGLTPQGRPIFAAHAELPWPDDDLLGLWHAATLVREHRGDGHISVLQHVGLDPVEATVLGGLYSSSTSFLRKTRGWTEEEYDAATTRLRERGWLDAEGQFTDDGRFHRQRVEDDTDRLALEGWAAVGSERTARLHDLVKPLREQIIESGLLPRTLRRSPAWPVG
jgi:Helix-turn-helix family